MQVIPAIDLRGGRVVRLRQGDFDQEQAFGADPAAVALDWVAQGAERLHIVDLDGAVAGRPVQLGEIARVIAVAGVPCQLGGGIRDLDAAMAARGAGADRVVLGTALLGRADAAAALVEALGVTGLVAALDVRNGFAIGEGWRKGAAAQPLGSTIDRLLDVAVRIFAITAIERDGMLDGPDLELLRRARARLVGAHLIASGGVASLSDLAALAQLGCDAAIVGRALYEGHFTLGEAIAAAAIPAVHSEAAKLPSA